MSECLIALMDNSEHTRSGDYAPTRFHAQADAVNLLAGAKSQAHPENTVGVLTMAGKTPQVLVTPTPDLGKVLNCMQEIEIEGVSNFTAAVQIAQLALKHRQNKNQRQRIVIFVASPMREDKETLIKIAKKLKKNSVAVDVVSFECEVENEEKLAAFHEAVNSNNNSHLVTVPPGPVLSDVLIGSPIFQGEGSGFGFGGGAGAAGGEGGGAGGPAFEFGVDPNMDPELALALRVSLEEERARQNAAAAAAGVPAAGEGAALAADGTATAEATCAAAGPVSTSAPLPSTEGGADAADGMELDEDALLQQALAMSMAVDEAPPAAEGAAGGSAGAPTPAAVAGPEAAAAMFDDVDDEELQLALAMSMADAEPSKETSKEE